MDHADDQRRAGESLELLLAAAIGQRAVALLRPCGQKLADAFARRTAIDDEAPGRELAMVGHA